MDEALPEDIEQSIRNLVMKVSNFPIPGVNFTDITPILERDPLAFRMLIQQMATQHRRLRPEIVVCIESFGYLFGAPSPMNWGAVSCWHGEVENCPDPLYDRHMRWDMIATERWKSMSEPSPPVVRS